MAAEYRVTLVRVTSVTDRAGSPVHPPVTTKGYETGWRFLSMSAVTSNSVYIAVLWVRDRELSEQRTCCGTPPGTSHEGTCPNSVMSTGELRFSVNEVSA
jgi:hypothetical protein